MSNIQKVLLLSTAHMTENDNDILQEMDFLVIGGEVASFNKTSGGYIIPLWMELPDEPPLEAEDDETALSAAFVECLRHAQELGCDYIWFDTDADTILGLEIFDW